MLAPLTSEGADMVIGSRFLGMSEELHGAMINRIHNAGNVLGNVVINALWNRTGTRITDAQNGFRSVRRRPFLTLGLEENGFAIEQEMVIKCLKKGYRIREVPSVEGKRAHGRSHIPVWYFFRFAGCIARNVLR
jgi:hypothetical protein